MRYTPARDDRLLRVLKTALLASTTACEGCGYAPPSALSVAGARPALDLLHAHHVRPVSCGGLDVRENLIVLCPTCHAIAHRCAIVRKGRGGWWHHIGPADRAALLHRFALLREEPAEFARRLATDHASDAAARATALALQKLRARRASRATKVPAKDTDQRANGAITG